MTAGAALAWIIFKPNHDQAFGLLTGQIVNQDLTRLDFFRPGDAWVGAKMDA